MAPKHESTVFSNIHIFARGECNLFACISRENYFGRDSFEKGDDRVQGEICNRKNESKGLYGIGRLNK